MRIVVSIEVVSDQMTPLWHASQAVQVPQGEDWQADALGTIQTVERITGQALEEIKGQARKDASHLAEFQKKMTGSEPGGS